MKPTASVLVLAACSLWSLAADAAAAAAEPPWRPLFDGKSLTGWVQRGGAAKYTVKDGAIVGTTVPNTPNSFLCTERLYGDFVLELEFKVDAELNAGVQIRGQSHPGYQNGRVHGYQVEIDPDVKRNRMWTGGLYDEGRRGWLADLTRNEPARKAFKPGDWNKFRVEAFGESIKTWLNGVPAAEVVDSHDLEGFIALQVHGVKDRQEPLQVAYRAIRIQDHGRHAWAPLLDGKTTKGFRAEGAGTWTVAPEGGGVLTGVLPAGKVQAPRQALLFVEKPAGDVTARLEYRITGGNAGLYVRAKSAEGGARGLQVDIDAAGGAGGLYETGGRGWVARPDKEAAGKAAKAARPEGWNLLTVSARGGHVVAHVNGYRTAVLDDDQGARDGALALEIYAGGPQEVRLEVRRLDTLYGPIPPPVPGYPIGWCIRANGTAPEDARTAGYEYVEIALQDVLGLGDDEFDKMRARLGALGIPVLTGYNLVPAELKLVGPEADKAKQDEHLRKSLARVAALGIKTVIFNSGPARRAPDGVALPEARKQLVDFSRRFAREAKKHGITVLLEPLRPEDTNMVNTVADAVAFVKTVGQPNFRLVVDYSFMALQKDDPASLAAARPYLRHVQMANPNGRVYPMNADEADYAAFFTALQKIGYKGGLSVHARTDNYAADAPRAIAFLRTQAAARLAAAPRK